jgi:serine/threonine protein kinase
MEDGRFAFVMKKEHFDLCSLIERQMGSISGKDCGPFSKWEAEIIMYDVAFGVNWLHSHDIVHRDLKASNVLVNEFESIQPKWICYVKDYEYLVGIVGT